jgi:hypothetical protein
MIFEEQPRLDYGKQSETALSMILENMLALHGLPADIFKPKVFVNDYLPYAPETTTEEAASGHCTVMLGQPFEGINITNFISLADKVEKQMSLITNVQLHIDDELVVTFPDEKKINLRITENWAFHAATTVAFRYIAIIS